MATISKAEAVWEGDLKGGNGKMKLGSGAYEGAYTWKSRFDTGAGDGFTNPEELIGAAHAGCYSMHLGNQLDKAGFKAESITTSATVNMDAGTITNITLDTEVKAPGIDQAKFDELVQFSKENCPVSKALASTPITVNATLK